MIYPTSKTSISSGSKPQDSLFSSAQAVISYFAADEQNMVPGDSLAFDVKLEGKSDAYNFAVTEIIIEAMKHAGCAPDKIQHTVAEDVDKIGFVVPENGFPKMQILMNIESQRRRLIDPIAKANREKEPVIRYETADFGNKSVVLLAKEIDNQLDRVVVGHGRSYAHCAIGQGQNSVTVTLAQPLRDMLVANENQPCRSIEHS